MKNYIHAISSIFLLMLVACNSTTEIYYSDLEVRDGILYLKGNETPFTGNAYVKKNSIGRRFEFPIRNGKTHGPVLEWDENGKLLFCMDYIEGKMEGHYICWGKSGKRKLLIEYRDGKMHGVMKGWWENGQLKYLYHYENDKKVGKQECWDQNANPITPHELHMLMHKKYEEEKANKENSQDSVPSP